MPRDQYEFGDPTTRYPNTSPEPQQQPEPGLESKMDPKPDHGEDSYRGTGRLTGRRALITGADSGIGAAVAIAYAREGADIALAYLPDEEEDAQRIVALVEAAGRKAVTIPGDLTAPNYPAALVERAVAELGGLDAIVTCAGKQHWREEVTEIPDEQIVDTFTVNVISLFRLVQAAVPHLGPGSTIITTASMEAYQPAPDRLDYAASKAAINNFSKGLAQQLVGRGIRVNVVAPGPTWSVLQVSAGVDPETLPDFGSSESPMGRPGQPAELAPAYVFLASAESSFVAGETLNVNGGMVTPDHLTAACRWSIDPDMRIVGRTASHLDPVVALLWRTHGLGADGSWADDPYAWLSPDGTVAAWVALDDDDRVLGHVVLVVAAAGRMPEMTRLVVDPDVPGADVADLLLDVVERSVPGPHVRLDVAEDAHTAWERYERRGWRLTGRGPAEWCGPDDAALTMRSYAKRVG